MYFLISLFLIGRCYAAEPTLVPLKNSSERISNLGLSILPPQGEDWYIITNNPNGGLNFSKMLESPSHTFMCSLTVVPIDENFENADKFLETVKQMQENFVDVGRFKGIKSNYNLNERFGSLSVEYQISVIDVRQKKKHGIPSSLKMHGYSFIHPKQPNYIVDIVYSERGNAENFTPSLQKAGKEFIDGLIIEE